MDYVIKISRADELIAVVPHLLGFRPQDSVVVLGFDARERVALVARVDRADCFASDVAAALADAMVREAHRTGATAAILVEFVEEDVSWGEEASGHLRAALGWELEARECWVVFGNRYWSPGCSDPGCCPAGGRVLPRGWDQADASGCAGPDAGARTQREDRRRARRAAVRSLARRDEDEPAWRVKALAEWRQAMSGPLPEPPRLGRLGASLLDVPVRDSVVLAAFGAQDDELGAVLGERREASTDLRLDAVMHGALEPDPLRSARLLDVLARVGEVGRAKERAAALAVTSLLEWWAGNQDRCMIAADQALHADGESRLAALVAETAARGILPGWLRHGS